jgi:uncharacterized membrane protein YebE (DUF533 family)
MTGNAIEEALITKIDHPAHTDPARPAALAGVALGLVVCVTSGAVLGFGVGAVLGLVLGGAVGGVLYHRWMARQEAARAAEAQARRQAHEDESARAIRAMMAKDTVETKR